MSGFRIDDGSHDHDHDHDHDDHDHDDHDHDHEQDDDAVVSVPPRRAPSGTSPYGLNAHDDDESSLPSWRDILADRGVQTRVLHVALFGAIVVSLVKFGPSIKFVE
jgi:hypothetical protein